MKTDFHNHLLPGIDDGSRDAAETEELLRYLCSCGVQRIFATPHYHAHRESTDEFLARRNPVLRSVREMISRLSLPVRLYGAAEVRLERGLHECEGLQRLGYEGLGRILLELPYNKFESWMPEEIYNTGINFGLTPVVAHLNRYFQTYSTAEIEEIISLPGVIIQINEEALRDMISRHRVRRVAEAGCKIILGTDLHHRENIAACRLDRIDREAEKAGITPQ